MVRPAARVTVPPALAFHTSRGAAGATAENATAVVAANVASSVFQANVMLRYSGAGAMRDAG